MISEHTYRKASLAAFPPDAGYAELEGLLVQPEQTFGIEFELTRSDFPDILHTAPWSEVAMKIAQALRQAHIPTGFDKDYTRWNVVCDGSCGWEVTSRILMGFEGFIEIADACKVLQAVAAECGLYVSARTGTHVHLGWPKNVTVLKQLVKVVAYFEPALFSLVAPSRANSPFARSVRRTFKQLGRLETEAEWTGFLAPIAARYLAVNARPLFFGRGTVEVRMHSGTVEATKILTWASLWMATMAAAEEGRELPGDPAKRVSRAPLCPGPRGDIVELARFVGANDIMIKKLVARRDYVVSRSWTQFGPARTRELARRLLAKWRAQGPATVGPRGSAPAGAVPLEVGEAIAAE